MKPAAQRKLRLPPAPRGQTVDLLYRTFGDLLVPVEVVRERYFHNLNPDNFTRALVTRRVPLPITTLDPSVKQLRFIDIRHLAIPIDAYADVAAEQLANNQDEPEEH